MYSLRPFWKRFISVPKRSFILTRKLSPTWITSRSRKNSRAVPSLAWTPCVIPAQIYQKFLKPFTESSTWRCVGWKFNLVGHSVDFSPHTEPGKKWLINAAAPALRNLFSNAAAAIGRIFCVKSTTKDTDTSTLHCFCVATTSDTKSANQDIVLGTATSN